MKHIWIINTENNTTIFYRNYSNLNLDPDLVSGLLSALDSFSKETIQSKGIESIEMSGYTWVYYTHHDLPLLCITASASNLNNALTKSRLEIIIKMFIDEFDLTLSKLRKLTKNSAYDHFIQTIDMLNNQWEQAEKAMGVAEIFDLLGIYQQIFNCIHDIIRLSFFGEKLEEINKAIMQFPKAFEDFPALQEDEQIKTIAFTPDEGWNIVQLNPMQVDSQKLQQALMRILNYVASLLKEKLGIYQATYEFRKRIFPYIFANWELVEKTNLTREIFQVFLHDQ